MKTPAIWIFNPAYWDFYPRTTTFLPPDRSDCTLDIVILSPDMHFYIPDIRVFFNPRHFILCTTPVLTKTGIAQWLLNPFTANDRYIGHPFLKWWKTRSGGVFCYLKRKLASQKENTPPCGFFRIFYFARNLGSERVKRHLWCHHNYFKIHRKLLNLFFFYFKYSDLTVPARVRRGLIS